MSTSSQSRRAPMGRVIVAALVAAGAAALGCNGAVVPSNLDRAAGGSGPSGGRGGVGSGGRSGSGGVQPDGGQVMADAAGSGGSGPSGPPDLPGPGDAAFTSDLGVDPGASDAGAGPGVWARGIQPGLVEIAQAIFIKVGDAGAVVPPAMRNSKLIEGRAAFLRLHVRAEPGFAARPLRAQLTVTAADGTETILTDGKTISGSSTSEKIDSSFNFLLPAELIKPKTTVSAAIYEAEPVAASETPSPSRFPTSGAADLGVEGGPMAMDVVLVPVRGPSGPLDDAPARRKRLEDYLADVYPAQKMTIRWHDTVTIPALASSAAAFRLLAVARRTDDAPAGTYYHLLIAVEDSESKFLGLGVGAGPRPEDAANRIAMTMVTEHQVDSQMDTVAHEMGHNLGQNHAPGCGASGVDDKFPYPATGVGVDGYSLGERALGKAHLPNAPGPFKSKAKFKDVMGYCYPTWISDYSWNAFMERIRVVNQFDRTSPLLETGALALQETVSQQPRGRSLQGFYQPGHRPEWVVVRGKLVPAGTPLEARRFARIERRDGTRTTAPLVVALMNSPAGPESQARTLAINLSDDANLDVASVELFVDGERFTVPAAELRDR
jgi:hypothetical protein